MEIHFSFLREILWPGLTFIAVLLFSGNFILPRAEIRLSSPGRLRGRGISSKGKNRNRTA